MREIIMSILTNPFWGIFTCIVGFAGGCYARLLLAFRQRLWDRADRLRTGFQDEIGVFSPDVNPFGRNYREIVHTRLAGHRRDADDFRDGCDWITRRRFDHVWIPYDRKAEEIIATEFPTEQQRSELLALMRQIASFTRRRI
jgi:hypothetical protein